MTGRQALLLGTSLVASLSFWVQGRFVCSFILTGFEQSDLFRMLFDGNGIQSQDPRLNANRCLDFFLESEFVGFNRSIYVLASIVLALTLPCWGAPSPAGDSDGPAELPRVHVKSSLADTPAPGRVQLVKEGEDLQQAIDAAKCGDTLQLQAGATFRGLYRFPQKSCDDTHWIIVRTSASDDHLPPEGKRMTPCYAGVVSLPGRPDFHCDSPQHVLVKIEFDGKGESGPIMLLDGANHYRFIGLEITRAVPEIHMRHLVQLKDPENAGSHVVFDRMWVHGNAGDETHGGIHLSGLTYAAIVDSYFSDLHCIAGKGGSCTDAQAINGGTGDLPGGPYKIENNFLEASGQSIMFGGAGGTTTPADIEIRRNHLFKPLIWKQDEPGYIPSQSGSPFIVKNNFELKNAQRLLFEDNLLENSWGGFTQTGFSIVLLPANQSGHCPQCRVTDITIRYNKIRNVGSVILIGNSPGKVTEPPAAGERYSIHDLRVEDIRGEPFKGFGLFAILGSVAPPVRDVRFDHITAFPLRAVMTVINRGDKIPGLSITNSIFAAGDREMGSAGGGPENCATPRDKDPVTVLDRCFANPVVSNNLIIGAVQRWPDGNILVKNTDAAGLWKQQTATGTTFHICREKGEAPFCSKPSPTLRAGSDGKNLGADVETIEQAIAGII